jgi:drug/metabolite transporter (DMT)-like permease
VFAGPLLLLPALGKPKEAVEGRALAWGLFAGVFFALDLGAWHYGVHLTSVVNATVLSNMTPVVVAIAAWLAFGEKPSRGFLIALAVALSGAIAMGLTKGSGGQGANPPLGNALSLVTAIFYGIYFVIIRVARRKAKTSALMLWTTISGGPAMLAMALAFHEQILPTGPSGWAACVGLGVMHVFGQGAIAWALGRLPATDASVAVLIQPVVAAFLGWVMLGEPVVPLQGLAACVVLAGVVLAQRSSGGVAPKAQAGKEKEPGVSTGLSSTFNREAIRAPSD